MTKFDQMQRQKQVLVEKERQKIIAEPLAELEQLRRKVAVYEKLKTVVIRCAKTISCPGTVGFGNDRAHVSNCNGSNEYCQDCWTTALAQAEGGE